jgi:hypothetical protein
MSARYLGDFAAGKTVRGRFNTVRPSTGAPHTLAGTPTLAVYKDGGTTESTAGVSLTVDFDGRTGLHVWTVDTSADGTFYSAGSDYAVVLTAGTVDGTSVAGIVVGVFSVANRSALRPTIADRTLNVDASGKVPATIAAGDIANDAITASVIASNAITAAKIATNAIGASQIAANAITSAKIAADAIGASQLAADAVAEIQSGLATAASQTTITTHLTDIKGGTFNGATDSLEAIRDRGDAAWITGSTLDAAGVWSYASRSLTDKVGFALASGGLDAVVVETGLNARQALSIIAASAAGTLAGAATTTITIDGAGVAIDRIVATVDADGNRTAVILTPPA